MPEQTKEKLVLLDAYAIIHRAFHALPNFTSAKTGEPTGALYGLSSFLIKTIRELEPDYIVACYDLPEPTFRSIAYEKYKAKRPQKEDILIKQIDRSRDILKAFNIPIYDSPGFEADDILGTIVEKVSGLKIIIASGDLDTLQLVKDDDVVVYTLSKGIKETIIYNEEKVRERYGFGPELVADYKALRGDPSDKMIGVKGIGEKTAIDLIKNFGGIENLYKNLKEKNIKERIMKLLEENEEEALFSKTLAEIRKDAPIDFALPEKKWKESFEKEKVVTLFKELGFKSLIERLP